MASYAAIAAVGTALVNLLKDASRTEFPQAKFKLFQAADFGDTNTIPAPEGASVYLYRLAANTSRRNQPPHTELDGTRTKPPLPLDLYFLITPWAATAEKQYRLLGWIMRVIEDSNIIPATLLNELEQNGAIFDPDESVEVFYDPLGLNDMAILWENLKQVKVLPSVTYVARLVRINSRTPFTVGEPVQTRIFPLQDMP
jgi:hypothetical protein